MSGMGLSDDHTQDEGENASGNQNGDSAVTYDIVDSGQSEDIESSLTYQGTSDREMTQDADRDEEDEAGKDSPKLLD